MEVAAGADVLSEAATGRAYLNDKFGRTGDLNLDINIRGRRLAHAERPSAE
ncbi:polymorphic toxin type 46 domain-containing protein [Roseateles sp. YR242]|uniref:polymorphic toxin type 46 domain-containing protein n=1 Tax=Roseateles sp. YR242 TaxID=1855305 RepID=UPI003857278E